MLTPAVIPRSPFVPGTAQPLQPRGELHASRAGLVEADSPKGYGLC